MADVFQKFLNLSRSERVDAAKGAFAEIIRFCESEGLSDEKILGFLCGLTRLFVSVDRSCEQGEYELFVDVTEFDITPQQFFDMTNHGADSEFVNGMLELIGLMSEDAKQAVAIFGLCICSADGEVTEAEKQMIARTVR